MKKLLFAAGLLVWGLAAQAMPAVGDYVAYKMTLTNIANGQTAEAALSMKFVSYDAAMKTFSVATTTEVNGQSTTQTQVKKETDFLNDAQVAEILTKCTEINGVREVINVNGRQLDTCKVSNSGAEIWIGSVPAAFVAVNTTKTQNGISMSMRMEVVDYSFGN